MRGMRKEKRTKHTKKGLRYARYGIFTLLLTCLLVTGYYLISNGVIFGKFTVRPNTYKLGRIVGEDSTASEEQNKSEKEAAQKKVVVTQQNTTTDEVEEEDTDVGNSNYDDDHLIVIQPSNRPSSTPKPTSKPTPTPTSGSGDEPTATPESSLTPTLTSDNEDLPVIPPSTGKKFTATNPFVILEVVPELSQQSFSYMVSSEEEGLPFNPVEMGIRFCNERSDGRGFLTSDKSSIDTGNLQNIIPAYAYFHNLFKSGMEIADESRMPYSEVDFLYEVKLYSSDISEDDFNNKTIQEIYQENPETFVNACPDLLSLESDEAGGIVVRAKDKSFKYALEEKNSSGQYTDRNWVKTKEENKNVTTAYKLTIPENAGLTNEDFSNLTMEQLAAKYPELFKKDDNDKEIPADVLAKNGKWVRDKKNVEEKKTVGYLVKVEKGKGEYTLNADNVYWHPDGFTVTKTGTDTDRWNYVESTEYPDSSLMLKDATWEMQQAINSDGAIGTWIKLEHDENGQNPYKNTISVQSNVYTFDYAKYVYTYKYAGLKINHILKYALFSRDTEEEYEKMHVKVIVVTPDMINEMDANDTENTIDYIERADLFYISGYYDGYNLSDDGVERFVDFYNLYCKGGSGEKLNGDKSKLKSYYDTDLEWWDCLKIINRLSTNNKLPLMMSKFVGAIAARGVEDQTNNKIYVDENNKSVDVPGALSNISKLYFIVNQFNLHKTDTSGRTFMGDILPKLKVMELNEDQQCESSHPPKYTGYYERTPLAECSEDDEYKKRCYYLWNKFTFLPTNISGIYKSQDTEANKTLLVESYGYAASYFFDNTFQNASGEVNRGAASSNGSDGYDGNNVTFAGNGQNDNLNMSLLTNVDVVDRMNGILRRMMDNSQKSPADLEINLLENKKYYDKAWYNQAFLDFSPQATYKPEKNAKGELADKEIILKLSLNNTNNEDAVITNLSLIAYDDIDKREEDITKKPLELCDYQILPSGESVLAALDKEDLKRSDGVIVTKGSGENAQNVNGYIFGKNTTVTRYVPFTLKTWQEGYNVLRIKWRTQLKYDKVGKDSKFFVKEGTSYIYIGERGLFNLE